MAQTQFRVLCAHGHVLRDQTTDDNAEQFRLHVQQIEAALTQDPTSFGGHDGGCSPVRVEKRELSYGRWSKVKLPKS